MDAEPAAPRARPLLPAAAHVDPAGQSAFLRERLLGPSGFVTSGGAKIKVVVGATGAGKTHFLDALLRAAAAEGFVAAAVDASERALGTFDLLYQAVAADLDLEGLARRFADRVVRDLGYAGPPLVAGQTLAAWAGEQGHDPVPLRARWEEAVHRRLVANADVDVAYGLGLQRWCDVVLWGGAEAGGPGGGAPSAGLLELWLRGGRVAVRDCNRLRLRRSLDRTTGRFWLRSLLHFIRMARLPGLVAAVDGLEALEEDARPRRARDTAGRGDGAGDPPPGGAVALRPSEVVSSGRPRYTKQRRDDFYECLRSLIDDMGLLPGFLLVVGVPTGIADPDNVRTGFASYPALASRLHSEVETVELNRFADEIVLERVWAADPEAGRTLAGRLVDAVAPGAPSGVRERALAAARAQWAVRDVAVSAVRRSVLAVLGAAGAEDRPGDVRGGADPAGWEASGDGI